MNPNTLRYGLGRALMAADRPAEAAELFDQVLDYEIEEDSDYDVVAETADMLANAYYRSGNPSMALHFRDLAAQWYVNAGLTWEAGRELKLLGDLFNDFGREETAQKVWNDAVDMMVKASDELAAKGEFISAALSEFNAATTLSEYLGRPADALPVFKSALARFDQLDPATLDEWSVGLKAAIQSEMTELGA
jgi:tetratricopeptide (TPR) repeat protein